MSVKKNNPVMYLVHWISENPNHTMEQYLNAIATAKKKFQENCAHKSTSWTINQADQRVQKCDICQKTDIN